MAALVAVGVVAAAPNNGNYEGAEKLGQNGTVADGVTKLMYAAANGYADVAKALLQGGAGVDVVAKDGKTTALLLARRAGHQAVIDILVQAGAK